MEGQPTEIQAAQNHVKPNIITVKADIMKTITDTRSEFDNRGYFLEYQPQLNIKARSIFCLEVLVRYRTPNGTILLPDIILPSLLQKNQLQALDEWVTAQAIEQQCKWQQQGHSVALCINLTQQTLACSSQNQTIIDILRKAVAPVIIEITQQATYVPMSRLEKAISDYHAAGIWVTIDDVGKANGSLALANELGIDGIKIDQSFTRTIATQKGARIMSSLLSIGSEMKMAPVVKGVETAREVRMLSDMGAACMQGWLFGVPQRAAVITQMIELFETNSLESKPYGRPAQTGTFIPRQ